MEQEKLLRGFITIKVWAAWGGGICKGHNSLFQRGCDFMSPINTSLHFKAGDVCGLLQMSPCGQLGIEGAQATAGFIQGMKRGHREAEIHTP